jgi:hypothetical protein
MPSWPEIQDATVQVALKIPFAFTPSFPRPRDGSIDDDSADRLHSWPNQSVAREWEAASPESTSNAPTA